MSINRTLAPRIQPIEQLNFRSPNIEKTENGVKIYSYRKTNDNTAQVDFIFDAGTLKGEKAIALATGELLLSGSKMKSSDIIEEEIDQLGGFIQKKISAEQSKITVYGLKENIVPILQIVIDAILHVDYPKKEIKQWRQSKKKQLAIQLEKVSVRTKRTFLKNLFENTPYGEQIEITDYDSVLLSPVQKFHKENYLYGLNHVNIIGELSNQEMEIISNKIQSFNYRNLSTFNYRFKYTPKEYYTEKDNAVQSAIRTGKLLFNRSHEDYKKFTVLNTLLGGYFGSRLMTSIREDKGYTYGIGSGVVGLQNTGYFIISTEVAKKYRTATLEAIREEIIKLQTEKVQPEELELVKNYMIGDILEQTDGAQQMMRQFWAVHRYHLSLSYYNEWIDAIHQTTPDDIINLANKYLKWDSFLTVSTG